MDRAGTYKWVSSHELNECQPIDIGENVQSCLKLKEKSKKTKSKERKEGKNHLFFSFFFFFFSFLFFFFFCLNNYNK